LPQQFIHPFSFFVGCESLLPLVDSAELMEDTVVFLVYVLLCPLDFCVKSLDLVPFDLLVELHVRIYR